MDRMAHSTVLQLLAAVVLCELVGILAGVATMPQIPTWYATLVKPGFTPPDAVFGPVWTLLYGLMGGALFLVWRQTGFSWPVRLFLIQLALNGLWSFLFFAFHRVDLALVDIILLLIAIALTMGAFLPVSRLAAGLMLPYLLWVAYATALNFAIWQLNPS